MKARNFNQKPASDTASEPIGGAIAGVIDLAAGLLGALIGADNTPSKPSK